MKNFKKSGYSTPEVAQILEVTPATVRTWTNNGKLDALVDGKVEKGHKRRIRITRDQLCKFLRSNKGSYSKEKVRAFLDSVKEDTVVNDSWPTEAYKANDISELTGAWANLSQAQAQSNLNPSETGEQTTHGYGIVVDGRIAVCNIEKRTVKTIITALLEDDIFKAKKITIEIGKG